MNRATMLPDMVHCPDLTVLERQRARFKWQQEQHDQQKQEPAGYYSELSQLISQGYGGGLMEQQRGEVKPDPDFQNGWPPPPAPPSAAVYGFGPGYEASSFSIISRTSSCPPAVDQVKGNESSAVAGRESFKKRKPDKVKAPGKEDEESRDKRMKGSAEEGDSKITEQNHNNNNRESTSADTSKAASEVQNQKPDYIHVRARRGQATDSHSLAERVRREKISERMKYLQDLVPGCNKITGKAGMLDEIINYVQSLQRQVEFLSMKLAAVNPRLDFNVDSFFAKEVSQQFPACPPGFPAIAMSSEMTNPAAYLHHFNSLHHQQQEEQVLGMNPTESSLRRTTSAPVPIPEPFLDSSCFPQLQPSSNWDPTDLQNFYNVASSFPSHPFTDIIEASNLKMEM